MDRRRFFQRPLQLLVGLFLDSLGVLQLLDKLHFDALHVENLVLFCLSQRLLHISLLVLVALRHLNLASLLFLYLHLG